MSGLTRTVTNYPNYNPEFCWFTRVGLLQNFNVIDTIYPEQQFIVQQYANIVDARVYINNTAGNYSSLAQRHALATSIYNCYVSLQTYLVKYICLSCPTAATLKYACIWILQRIKSIIHSNRKVHRHKK